MRKWINEAARFARSTKKPLSISQYIGRNGGLRLDGDAKAADLHKVFVPGGGPLARKGGLPIDGYWREHLADLGYIERDPDGTITRDVRDEVHNLIRQDLMKRQFGDGTGSGISEEEYNEEIAGFEHDIMASHNEAGMPLTDRTYVRAAAELMWKGKFTDPLDAYEHAVMNDPHHQDADDDFDDTPPPRSSPPASDSDVPF